MGQENNNSGERDDWDKRTLCSDPACIGVIGPDGRCKECGRSYEGDAFEDRPFEDLASEPETEVEQDEQVVEADDEVESLDEEEPMDDEVESLDEEEPVADEDWSDRTLCSDPACIGVIGSDGRCKECGKPYDGESS